MAVERSPLPERLPTYVESLLAEVAARAASKVVEVTSENASSATKLIRTKHVKAMIGAIAGVLATCGGGGYGMWKLAGPEQATERAEASADKADDKAKQLEELRSEIEVDRRNLVDGRLNRVETKVGNIEGRLAGQDGKLDALLDVTMGESRADKVREKAEKAAEAVEHGG